jgi:hypothetical protein
MARKHEAAQLLKQGNSPVEIAKRMGVSVRTVMGYLYTQVGEGEIKRSDILFSIGEVTRRAVVSVEEKHTGAVLWDYWTFQRVMRSEHPEVDSEEAWTYRRLRTLVSFVGDMYWDLFMIEFILHKRVQEVLMRAYGEDWWSSGIPENIRVDCQVAREKDPERAPEPYCYTTLIHLKEIIDRRWTLFAPCVPKAAAANKAGFLAGLTKVNQLRNRVMHLAARFTFPSEDEFRSLKQFLNAWDFPRWQMDPGEAGLIEAPVTSQIQ